MSRLAGTETTPNGSAGADEVQAVVGTSVDNLENCDVGGEAVLGSAG